MKNKSKLSKKRCCNSCGLKTDNFTNSANERFISAYCRDCYVNFTKEERKRNTMRTIFAGLSNIDLGE